MIIISLVVSLFLAEAILGITPYNTFGAGKDLKWTREQYWLPIRYVVDPDFGFRPILGNDYYNIYGTRVNAYTLDKRPGITKLLFLGDSVTQAGYIIEGLKQAYGQDRFEYWNAGVGSFNTVQEVNFYKRYNRLIMPEQVILTFHLNDFETTPVAFFNSNNQLVVFAPGRPIKKINKFLFKSSLLYRLYLGIVMRADKKSRSDIEEETKRSIIELRDLLVNDHVKLTVLISPTCLPYERWNEYDKEERYKILNILQESEIRFYDLTEVIDSAQRGGIVMYENDFWHPSRQMGTCFAEYLFKNGLLAGNNYN